MKRNTSRLVFQRHNVIKELIFDFFLTIASRPRLLLEVFIRQRMGRRYFRISSALTVLAILIAVPYIDYDLTPKRYYYGGETRGDGFWGPYITWYLFAALFVFFCVKRAKETYPHGSVYDYNYFSLSSGYSLAIFDKLPFLPKKPSAYMVEVFIEPGVFFIVGLLLIWFDQHLGRLLVTCSICYGFSYAAAYHQTDEKLQGIIDDIISAEEFERSFVNGFDAARGTKPYPRPSDEDLRQRMASRMYSPQNEPEDAEFTVL